MEVRGFEWEGSAVTYFHTGNLHYHRRGFVSLSCSEWEGVGPKRYCHRALKLEEIGKDTFFDVKDSVRFFDIWRFRWIGLALISQIFAEQSMS